MHKWNPEDYERAHQLSIDGNGPRIPAGSSGRREGLGHRLRRRKDHGKVSARVPWGKVLGLDLSSEMVDYARSKDPPESWTNLAFRLAFLGTY
jgi:hypothetical protein